MAIRTDLALEANELWQASAQKTTQLSGVISREQRKPGLKLTSVRITNAQGAQALGKPVGTYLTLELEDDYRFSRAVRTLAGALTDMLRLTEKTSVLVVGLGNPAVTPDALGPGVLPQLLLTRHLIAHLPEHFGSYRSVSAIAPGVLGTTGMESAEIVRGTVERTRPDRVLVIDALASRSVDRLCRTVQLADTGIVPGSGVKNHRAALNQACLGVPVLAVGVPTVVDAATIAEDLTGAPAPHDARHAGLIVTPREIDRQLREIAKLLAYGINAALHPNVSTEILQKMLQ